MNTEEIKIKLYRKAVNRCAVTMTVWLALYYVLFIAQAVAVTFLEPYLDDVTFEVVSSLSQSAVYLAVFMLPIFVYRAMCKKDKYQPMPAAAVLPKHTFKICVAAVSTVFVTALLNSLLVNYLVGFFGFTPDMSILETEINGVHSFFLLFISTALVPAFCEEFLFRGVFLRNLLPYGKTVAIVISSLFFALMHQNFYQTLYTFAAGLVLGYVFTLTGSVWCGVIIHGINNFLSVLTEVFYHYMNEDAAVKAEYLLYTVFVFAGVLSLAFLIKAERKEKKTREGSVYGRTERVLMPIGDTTLDDRSAVKNFFTPAVWIFLAVTLLLTFINLLPLIKPVQ